MTPLDFSDFLASAQTGEAAVYHVGLLARAREYGFHPESARINAVANNVWMAHRRGQVTLTQRRISQGVCEYIATRTGV